MLDRRDSGHNSDANNGGEQHYEIAEPLRLAIDPGTAFKKVQGSPDGPADSKRP